MAIKYVIKKGEKYVNDSDNNGYTSKIEKALLFDSRKEAEWNVDFDNKNEHVVKVDIQVTELPEL